jgi:hypothetical protein
MARACLRVRTESRHCSFGGSHCDLAEEQCGITPTLPRKLVPKGLGNELCLHCGESRSQF